MKLKQVKLTQSNIDEVFQKIKENCEICNENKLFDFGGLDVIKSVVAVVDKLLGIRSKMVVEDCLFREIIFYNTDGKMLERIVIK